MSERHQLIAYLATLGTLAVVVIAALAFGAFSQHVIDKIEAFGIGTVTGGLIGVLRIPTSRAPVATTDKGDVNVAPNSEEPR